jgi:DNA-binding transcriptional LysR family regulator
MARDIVSRVEAAENIVRGLARNEVMSVSLVAPETTVADVLAPYLATRSPEGTEINVCEALPNEIFEMVASGNADVGISSGPVTADLDTRPLVQFPIWAYAATEHPLAGERSVRLERLVQEPLVLLGEQHGTRRVFDDAVAQQALTYRLAAETNVPQIAQAFAAAGRGVAVVTDDPRYDLQPLAIETTAGTLTITLFAAWDRTHYAALMLEELVEELAAFVERRYGARSQPWITRSGGVGARD